MLCILRIVLLSACVAVNLLEISRYCKANMGFPDAR